MADEGEVEQRLGDEVAVAHRVERVLEPAVEPELLGDEVGIDPERRAGERTGAERRHVEAAPGREHAVDVARERPPVREQVVGEEHGLRPLQMGVPGQVGVADLRGASFQGPLQLEHVARSRVRARARVNSRSAVATWSFRLRPVWSLAPLSGASSVTRRSIAVWMSSSVSEIREAAARQLRGRPRCRASTSESDSVGGEDARPQQAVNVGDRAPHVAGCEPLVERQAGGEGHQGLRRGGAHPAAPKRHSAPPWRADQVWMPRPNRRTKPFGVLVTEGVGGVVGGEVVDVEPGRAAPADDLGSRRPG